MPTSFMRKKCRDEQNRRGGRGPGGEPPRGRGKTRNLDWTETPRQYGEPPGMPKLRPMSDIELDKRGLQ